ncbi:MAG: adenylate kinase [Candidatus Peribacteraceae bacterium]|nr:adenylate kinase [Candidatus Peribacteraceae bacterium]
MDLIFFGIQGSGKGTQAKRIAAEFGYEIFEAGGELRSIATSGSKLGETVSSYMNDGKLVPHEIIMEVLQVFIEKRSDNTKIIFDGIPRDKNQQKDFDFLMEKEGRNFKCIHLLLDKEKAVQRILGRAEKEGRADDADESIIRKRMATFEEKTEPVIQDYKNRGLIIEVNGNGKIDDVYDRISERTKEMK